MKKKLVPWLVIVLVIYYVVTEPDAAAGTADAGLDALNVIGDGFIAFFKSLSQ